MTTFMLVFQKSLKIYCLKHSRMPLKELTGNSDKLKDTTRLYKLFIINLSARNKHDVFYMKIIISSEYNGTFCKGIYTLLKEKIRSIRPRCYTCVLTTRIIIMINTVPCLINTFIIIVKKIQLLFIRNLILSGRENRFIIQTRYFINRNFITLLKQGIKNIMLNFY